MTYDCYANLAPLSAENWHKQFMFRGVRWDMHGGIGAVGYQSNALYMGALVVLSVESFLQLAMPISPGRHRESARWLLDQMRLCGPAIGPPSLFLHQPSPGKTVVTGHEGRHRALAFTEFQLLEKYAGAVVPVFVKWATRRAPAYTIEELRAWVEQPWACERDDRHPPLHAPKWFALFHQDAVLLAPGVRLQ